ncbi:MAG: glycoside hydrolase, end-alpha-1,4-polygalactosaminidase [Proteobacteria bacterium]|nr:MAG: glycoside hydrolase, end-alpha-1,4-polygalactosaminidase [Pseudomonadota bacterium]
MTKRTRGWRHHATTRSPSGCWLALACAVTLAGCASKAAFPDDAAGTRRDAYIVDSAADTRRDSLFMDAPPPKPKSALHDVKYWAYQIQSLWKTGAIDTLVASQYDLVVIDPTRSNKAHANFDTKGAVTKLKASTGLSGKPKIVIAYIDIGEAESWRDYWEYWWTPPTPGKKGNPSFLLAPDPDGWTNNYPVAYWDDRWKSVIIHSANSLLKQILDDGFDGVYLDWVEGYLNKDVIAEAKAQKRDPAFEMTKFIGEMRAYARKRDPSFLFIQQNAAELGNERLDSLGLIDAIAQEQIWFDGKADTEWADATACDIKVPATGDKYSQAHYLGKLKLYKDYNVPIFNCEYACGANAQAAYQSSSAEGFIPYVSRRPLDRLTDTPPPGYPQ